MLTAFSLSTNPAFASNILENAELSVTIQEDDKINFQKAVEMMN